MGWRALTGTATDALLFRRATPADAATVRDLTRAAFARWVPVVGREPRPMTADYDRAVREHRIDLAYIGGELAGLIEMIEELNCLYVENVAVAPARQGRGLGAMLMARADATAAQIGYSVIRLYTNKLMTSNIRLYQALGYAIDGEQTFHHATVVYMSKAAGIALEASGDGR